jgi:hypothetical protein
MIGGGIPNIEFQTFYVSREKSNCPFIPEIIRSSKNLKKSGIIDEKSSMVFSQKYGKRVLINSEVEDFSDIKHEELIEIVDFNPLKNTLLVIGPGDPRIETPIHWMIHHARNEINAVVQLNDISLIEKLKSNFSSTEHNFPTGSIEQIKDILKKLRGNKIVVVKDRSIIFVGESLKEVENLIVKTVGELK